MLDVQEIAKAYRGKVVLNGISFGIAAGTVYGLLGPNGAGKTTAISILSGLMPPDRGTVWVNGVVLSRRCRPWIGVAPQGNIFYRHLTCAENLRFFARIYGVPEERCRKNIYHVLDLVGLMPQAQHPAHTLSGGMLRRLNLAIALVHQPRLLILDEPSTGLDLEARQALWQLVEHLRAEGMAILLTTHLLDEAERLCQLIGILKDGTLLCQGTMAELRQIIAAAEIVQISSSECPRAIARAQELGLTYRLYGPELIIWLPQTMPLRQILDQFDGIALEAVRRQPVTLEHIYREVTAS
ncbi:MAG: ABC transporter ATP-binding protein [Oscillatoriales cyanobacterium SM2_2_1]|nr:ABC transporter ATP-binding protein [Oscillatoriales cyanobacterium SM2_2_1]